MSLQALRDRCSKTLGATKQHTNGPQSTFGTPKSINHTSTNNQPDMAQPVSEDLETALENTIKKNEQLERELNQQHQYCQNITAELQSKEKQIRKAQDAQEQIEKLKSENARLHKQLQAEKAENVGRLGWKQRDNCAQDLDDSETELEQTVSSLPTRGHPLASAYSYGQYRPNAPNETSKAVFKMPRSIEALTKMDSLLAEKQSLGTTTKHELTLTKKRKRTKQEEIDDELPNLHLDDFIAPTGPRKKKRPSAAAAVGSNQQFPFVAVGKYDDRGNPIYESVNTCEILQERIAKTKDIWEHNKGEDWSYEFTKTDYKPVLPVCVTMKLAGRRTKWRQYDVGRYACQDCVKNGRPCFTWVQKQGVKNVPGWQTWDFRLLPMHEDDRTRAVVKGKSEVRYWLNDATKFQDKDVLKREEGDEDYVD